MKKGEGKEHKSQKNESMKEKEKEGNKERREGSAGW